MNDMRPPSAASCTRRWHSWSQAVDLLFSFRSYYALSIWSTYLVYGIIVMVYYATWYDLTRLLGVSDATMGWAMTLNNFLYCFGALSAGFVFNHAPREPIMAGCLLVLAIQLAASAYCGHFITFVVIYSIGAFAQGGIDVGCNVIAFKLFAGLRTLGPILQSLHLLYSAGGMIAAAMAEPFLSPDDDHHHHNDTKDPKLMTHVPKVMEFVDPFQRNPYMNTYPTRIWIPYMIATFLTILCTINLMTAFFLRIHREKVRASRRQNESTNSSANDQYIDKKLAAIERDEDPILMDEDINANNTLTQEEKDAEEIVRRFRSPRWRGLGVALACIALGAESVLEITTQSFLINYLVGIGVAKPLAAHMNTMSMLGFNVMRVVCFFVTLKLPVKYLFLVSLTLVIGSNAVLATFDLDDNLTIIWICVIAMQAGFGPTFPAIYAYSNERIMVTNTVGGLMMGFGGLLQTMTPLLVANYINTHPVVTIYVNLFFVTFIVASLIGLEVFRLERRPEDLEYHDPTPGHGTIASSSSTSTVATIESNSDPMTTSVKSDKNMA